MIFLLTTRDQAELDIWWNKQLIGPNAAYFMHSTHSRPPVLDDRTWEMIALGHRSKLENFLGYDSADAYLFLHVCRDYPALSASVILVAENPRAIRALLRDGEVAARAHGIAYLDASVAVTNERSLRLATKYLGEPWGREPESVNFKGKMVDCLRFRKKLI